ncbi:DUF5132 domain-containing protein [Saccharothrix sp. ST-888]|uniref:DUF5132 domain-containing protein n=1 Tax=Saccharothrix sp. ST-888 TaxID=1427391 RepID=UPI0005ED255D|nr:DUF5132 domain-containing protein [Saccharothrix sp. ST-888]KJK57983.1 hypothetical protein UK12_12975 [Saccharothrix sp. ST-888]
MPPVVPPFLIGLVVAPVAKRLLKPLVRGVVKTSVGLVLEVKKAAHEAGENIHDLAAEVAAEMVAAQIVSGDTLTRTDVTRGADSDLARGEKSEASSRSEGENRTSKIRATAGTGAGAGPGKVQ